MTTEPTAVSTAGEPEESTTEPFDYEAEMDRAMMVVQFVMRIDAAQIQKAITAAHTIGPIMDPTRYRDGMRNLEDARVVASGLLAAQGEFRKSDRLMAALRAVGAVE